MALGQLLQKEAMVSETCPAWITGDWEASIAGAVSSHHSIGSSEGGHCWVASDFAVYPHWEGLCKDSWAFSLWVGGTALVVKGESQGRKES